MGWDYDSVQGDESYHLTMAWGGKLVTALHVLGAFDHNITPPEPPTAFYVERDENDPWPEGDNDEEVIAYFGFQSPRPAKVPAIKLGDNSLWLITAEEAGFLADLIEMSAEPELIAQLEPEYSATLAVVLEEFGAFCRASSRLGGFWAY